jgi:hypothetical protein
MAENAAAVPGGIISIKLALNRFHGCGDPWAGCGWHIH